jgi:cobalt-zinc-cadmium efflux system membrane fusion protein
MIETEPSSYSRPARTLPKRTQLFIVAAIAVGAAVIISVAAAIGHARSEPVAAEAPKAASGTFRPTKEQWASLKVTPVEAMTFRTELVTDGTISYNEDLATPVFSPYSGRVARLVAKLGDVVKKGDPLLAVEATEFVQAQNDFAAGIATLDTARAQLDLGEASEKRQHELYLAKAGALKDWRQSEADLATARNNLRSAQTAVAAARNRLRILGKSDAEIAALEAAPQQTKMSPVAVVGAPIAGTVTQRQVGLGQFITSASAGASNPVYTVSDLSTVWLVANVRETDAPLLRVGQPVEVEALAYPGRTFKARLAWIAPAVDGTTRRLPVRAEVANPGGALKPMMFASFHIVTGDPVTAPGVPQSAIVYQGENARVFVARDDGAVELRTVRTGRTHAGMIEVSSGLRAGEKIVTSGTLFIDRAIEGT